ncbi:MAG: hypothetical protein AAGF12_33015 [Myxococcota bacterium]
MAGRSFDAQTIVDGQIAIAFTEGVVTLVLRVDEWDLEVAERLYAESTVLTHANPHTVVQILGEGPNAAVRKRLADLQASLDEEMPVDGERRVAVIIGSAVMRGAVTALRWVTGDQIRGFAPDAAYEAAVWAAGHGGAAEAVFLAFQDCMNLMAPEQQRTGN